LRTDEIIALLEELAERPLASEPESAELRAFCREAVRRLALERGEAEAPETEHLTALMATVISGGGTAQDRDELSAALAGSSGLRLEAAASAAYLEAIAQAPRTAPADLVEDLIAGDTAPALAAAARAPRRRFAPGLRTMAACAVVLIAAGATWSVYRWQEDAGETGEGVLKKSAPLKPLGTISAPPAEAPRQSAAPAPPPAPAPAPPDFSPLQESAAPPRAVVAPLGTPVRDAARALHATSVPAKPVATIAVTAKPAAPCPPPADKPASEPVGTRNVVPAAVDVAAAPPLTDCAAPPTDRFADGPVGPASSEPPAASAPAQAATRVLRPTLTAPPVEGSLGRLVAPTPLSQAPPPTTGPQPNVPLPQPAATPAEQGAAPAPR